MIVSMYNSSPILSQEGIFISETKNRFLCQVLIDNVEQTCYIPSSCRLDNFIDLKNRKVLLSPTQAKTAQTQWAVSAIPYKRSYILLNSSYANRSIERSLFKRHFSFLGKRRNVLHEHMMDGYKSDFFIKDTHTILEVKSVICTDRTAVFPTVFSQRAIEQLEKLYLLLQHGYQVVYVIVSLNPYVIEITLNRNSELASLVERNIKLGMQMKGYTCRFFEDKGDVEIEKSLRINI